MTFYRKISDKQFDRVFVMAAGVVKYLTTNTTREIFVSKSVAAGSKLEYQGMQFEAVGNELHITIGHRKWKYTEQQLHRIMEGSPDAPKVETEVMQALESLVRKHGKSSSESPLISGTIVDRFEAQRTFNGYGFQVELNSNRTPFKNNWGSYEGEYFLIGSLSAQDCSNVIYRGEWFNRKRVDKVKGQAVLESAPASAGVPQYGKRRSAGQDPQSAQRPRNKVIISTKHGTKKLPLDDPGSAPISAAGHGRSRSVPTVRPTADEQTQSPVKNPGKNAGKVTAVGVQQGGVPSHISRDELRATPGRVPRGERSVSVIRGTVVVKQPPISRKGYEESGSQGGVGLKAALLNVNQAGIGRKPTGGGQTQTGPEGHALLKHVFKEQSKTKNKVKGI